MLRTASRLQALSKVSILVALVLMGMWMVRVLLSTTAESTAAVGPIPEPEELAAAGDPTTDSPRDSAGDVKAPETLESRLREYWGADWERVRKELIADGVDLQVAYDFPEWEQVAQGFESMFQMTDAELEGQRATRVGWPKELSAQWLAENFAGVDTARITAVELAEIETLTAQDNHELNQIFDAYIDEFGAAMESTWRRGEFLKAPFSTAGLSRTRDSRAFFSSARAYSGWGVKYHLYAEDHPGILEAMEQMRELRRQRDRTVRKYLKSL
jgi:hypothetical protein